MAIVNIYLYLLDVYMIAIRVLWWSLEVPWRLTSEGDGEPVALGRLASVLGPGSERSSGAGWHGDRRGLPGLGHREAGSETLLGQIQLLATCCVPVLLARGVVWLLGHPCPPPAP